MDWYIIEYLYPRAFKKFTEIMFPNLGVISVSSLDLFDVKKLYNFFDKQGIYLTVELYRPHQWCFTISLQNGMVLSPSSGFKTTRTDSEYEGFIECFKFLDKKLIVVYE